MEAKIITGESDCSFLTEIRENPRAHHAQHVSKQHGKHRHVSKNTITRSDLRGNRTTAPIFKVPEPRDNEIRSTRPSLLTRIWNKLFHGSAGKTKIRAVAMSK